MSTDLHERAMAKAAVAAGQGLAYAAAAALGPVGAALLGVGALAALEIAYQCDQKKENEK